MTNNDVLRRLRYCFNFNDAKMIGLFALADHTATRAEVSAWLKADEEVDGYKAMTDPELAIFLNGFINDKRGKKDGPQHPPEARLNNNIIFRKLKIALNLTSEDMLDLLELAQFSISKHELSAFFRKADHQHYRPCKDQVLRNLLKGLQVKHRDSVWAQAEKKED